MSMYSSPLSVIDALPVHHPSDCEIERKFYPKMILITNKAAPKMKKLFESVLANNTEEILA